MKAKTKQVFVLTVGTNDENITQDNLIEKAAELEQMGNRQLGVRFHIEMQEEE